MKARLLLTTWIALSATTSQADVFEWAIPGTKAYNNSASWTDVTPPTTLGTPGVGDVAVHNVGGTYAVVFNQDEFSDEVFVEAGSVSFISNNSTARTYSISTDGGSSDVDIDISGGDLQIGAVGTPVHVFGLDAIVFVGVGAGLDDTLSIVGSGSVLTAGGTSRTHPIGATGGDGTLEISNQGVADFGGTLDIGVSNSGASDGVMNVESGGLVFAGNLSIGTRTSTATGVVTVNGSTSEISVTDVTTIGSSSGGIGTLNIQSNGTFSTGTGTTTINATGTLNLNAGTFDAQGDVDVDGGTIAATTDTLFVASGKTLTATNNATLNLSGNYDINGGATWRVESGSTLDANRLDVGVLGSDGTLVVDNATVAATAGSALWGFNGSTAIVTLSNAAQGTFGSVFLADSTSDDSEAQVAIETGADFQAGDIRMASVDSGAAGTLTVDGNGSTVTQTGASTLTVGSTLGTGSATINLDNNGLFITGTGTTTINATGTLNLDGGTFDARGNVNIDGGMIDVTTGTLTVASGKTLTATNNATLTLSGNYIINGDATWRVESGSTLDAFAIDIGSFGGDGTLVVDNATVAATGGAFWGFFDNTANVTLRNAAQGTFGQLRLADTNSDFSVAQVTIETGADLQAADIIMAGANSGATGTLTIDGSGSTLTQTGASTLILGSPTGTGSATVNVQNGGTLTTGSGTTTLDATGTINLSGGTLSATTIDHTNGGDFNFTGGTLSVETFQGDLLNQGGMLAPGASAGSTTIVGDYTQQTGATLAIEIGGTAAVTEFDFVSVSGDVLLDGLLELSLIDGFVPVAANTFTVLTAGTLTGFFDNATPGARLDTAGGEGSFLVNIDFGADQIVLSNFLSSLTGDFDNDSDVDGRDFLVWQRGGSPNGTSSGDLALWHGQYGSSTLSASATAVPEPGTLPFWLIIGCLLFSRNLLIH
ncbi:beta strand repeat-containing protein [Bythopirellula polymerisocia]|uniref:Autotransporter-associated beta strand repeat protein n=1 Tax=Bythopirellula polymerisocia TaxID=2528003 RepID=A0A5C6D3E0_9BACT|nr:hypothetical protein [Bythopirellula polymerisocia]TWU30177.1 hypothetical protein Pla144_09630 [Bythopirellula polymerisocia]